MDFIVKKIKTLKRVRPDASWVSSQRSFLLSEISQSKEQEKKRKPSLVLPLFNFNILKILRPNFAIALVIIILISSLATVGVISASQNSLPGDFLYPLKTAFEETQLTLTPGEANKTKLSIKFATQRMDEFTQLIDKPEKKKDIEKTVQKFTAQLVSVQENIDKLKEKNAEKAAEVAKLVKAQTPLYQEALTESAEKLAYVIPEDKEDIKKVIDEAIIKTKEISEGLTGEPAASSEEPALKPSEEGSGEEEVLVPGEEETIESPSMPFEEQFENLQPEEIEAE